MRTGRGDASNDIAVNLRRQFLLFLWRDKRIPPVVPLSCLANKMIHSPNLCKSFGNYAVYCTAARTRKMLRVAGMCCVLAAELPGWEVPAAGRCRISNVSRWTMRGCGFGAPARGLASVCSAVSANERSRVGALWTAELVRRETPEVRGARIEHEVLDSPYYVDPRLSIEALAPDGRGFGGY